MAFKFKLNAGKFLPICFVYMFFIAVLSTWIPAPHTLSLSMILSSVISAAVMSLLLTLIMHKIGGFLPKDDASKAAYIVNAQAEASQTLHWSRSPILWVGGATALLFCFLRFAVVG